MHDPKLARKHDPRSDGDQFQFCERDITRPPAAHARQEGLLGLGLPSCIGGRNLKSLVGPNERDCTVDRSG